MILLVWLLRDDNPLRTLETDGANLMNFDLPRSLRVQKETVSLVESIAAV